MEKKEEYIYDNVYRITSYNVCYTKLLRIDIVQWSPDKATLIVNALAPAEVAKVVFDEENNKIEVVVPDEQLSLAIGRRGQNVKLASIS